MIYKITIIFTNLYKYLAVLNSSPVSNIINAKSP